MIDPHAGRAFYRQVADVLRAQIAAGTLAKGADLPPEKAIADRYGVGVDVIQDALRLLVAEGLVEKRRGHPARVRETPPMSRIEVDLRGREVGARGATEAEARQHGIAVGSPMLVLVEVTADGDLELDAWPADRTRLRPADG